MALLQLKQKHAIALRAATLLYIAYRAYSHKSLTNGAIIAALGTGIIHALPESSLYITLIVVFFLTSSKATKYKESLKSKKTKTAISKRCTSRDQSQRTVVQVFANSIVASVLIIFMIFANDETYRTLLKVGAISQYCAVTADTWSSELGILSTTDPFLITTFRRVPPGTNGGVTFVGLVSGLAGSSLISFISVFTFDRDRFLLWIFFSTIGLLGSLIDSLLGALIQLSVVDEKDGLVIEALGGHKLEPESVKGINIRYIVGINILSNNGVNITMAALTSSISIAIYNKYLI